MGEEYLKQDADHHAALSNGEHRRMREHANEASLRSAAVETLVFNHALDPESYEAHPPIAQCAPQPPEPAPHHPSR